MYPLCHWSRAGRGVPHHQLVPGAGHAVGQPAVRAVEPDGRGLPAGLCAAGHLGHLRQGLGAAQDAARQPARLLALVRLPGDAVPATRMEAAVRLIGSFLELQSKSVVHFSRPC